MGTDWLRFWRTRAVRTLASPDNTVTEPQPWLLGAVIVASTAALLGTSDASAPSFETNYSFERLGIDGGFVELTRDEPTATFLVTVHVNDLGPDGVSTANQASASLQGNVIVSGLADTATTPSVSVRTSSPNSTTAAFETVVTERLERFLPLNFTGDCANPKASGSCAARFKLELTRQDGGAGDGVVRFDWMFDVRATARATSTEELSDVGPLDPPWTVEVSVE